jgi:hypothetical protein
MVQEVIYKHKWPLPTAVDAIQNFNMQILYK